MDLFTLNFYYILISLRKRLEITSEVSERGVIPEAPGTRVPPIKNLRASRNQILSFIII